MSAIAVRPHSHAEQWALQPRLSNQARALALEVLPMLRLAKRALIDLAGHAIVGSSPDDLQQTQSVAAALAERCRHAGAHLGANDLAPDLAPLHTNLLTSVSALEVWASAVVAGHGRLTAESAAGLRQAYVQLRAAADPFWRLELVPEGRTAATDDAGRQWS